MGSDVRKPVFWVSDQVIPRPACSATELLGHVVQWVRCLATDANLTADPGVVSLIPAWSHSFVEIDHEIICKVFFLLSTESFMKGCCQLQAKLCAQITG